MKKPISEKERIRKVEVVAHNPAWKTIFQDEANLISKILGDNLIAAHHIGSTAISLIKAKPIIDILLVVKDLAQLDNANEAMCALHYESMGEYGIVGRRFYFKNNNGARVFHVHAFQKGNSEIDRHINFIRYLENHPDVAKEYSLLKESLAKQFPNDIQSYVEGKNEFVKRIDGHAKNEYAFNQYHATVNARGCMHPISEFSRRFILFAKNKVVADIGCAYGNVALAAAEAGATKVIACDMEEKYLEAVREQAEDKKLDCIITQKGKFPQKPSVLILRAQNISMVKKTTR